MTTSSLYLRNGALKTLSYPHVRGMRDLNREAFRRTILVSALRCLTTSCHFFTKKLRHVLLRGGLKGVVDDPLRKDQKMLLLGLERGDVTLLPEDVQEEVRAGKVEFITQIAMEIGYSNLSVDQVLHWILPEKAGDVIKAFDTVGHVAHMNLRPCHESYKRVIGQVILSKNNNIKTVVNKVRTIDNEFRNFKMEIIAGIRSTEVTLNESGCRFQFDFAKVFWNSRLQAEHSRLLNKFTRDDVVCDVFAGVGPFAVPAARRRSRVYANDLNPDSFKSLQHNAKLNAADTHLTAFCMDGRDFLRHITNEIALCARQVSEGKSDWFRAKFPMYTHVIMNLPAVAVEFLDVFHGLLDPLEEVGISSRPMIHCYCFSKADDLKADALKRVEEALGVPLRDEVEVVRVRDVAPKKEMMCVSFRLPHSTAWSDASDNGTLHMSHQTKSHVDI